MLKRKIIQIDEAKCNGCGQCIPNCHEGALRIIDGKARLISDSLCDGLGACLGYCPQDAITIEEREVQEYNNPALCACPGAKVTDFRNNAEGSIKRKRISEGESQLKQWPIQIILVPTSAPYLNNADLLIAADCVPFAYAGFHEDLLRGKTLLVGCPKLDDTRVYQEKLLEILKNNDIKSITYACMEVPCCSGLVPVIKSALSTAAKDVPFKEVIISIRGERIQ